jgi:hypothetical protein
VFFLPLFLYSITGPTYSKKKAIEESVTLAKRLGAQVVVGVGSGAAIDVAKSVATILTDEDSSNDIDLILSPATLGGCLASTSEEPLLLSTEEEALLPLSSTSELWNESMHPVIPTILMDEKDFDTTNDSLTLPPHFSCGVLASLVIALDAAFFATTHNCRHLPHGADYTDSIYKTIDHAMEALTPHHGSDTSSRQRHAVSAALYSGNILNLGNRYYQRRSAPISIASALLPPFFPHGNILTYIASMLPGLCATISEYRDSTVQSYDSNNYILLEHAASRLTEGGNSWKDTIEWANRISTYHNIPTMASLAEGAPATSTLLDRMESNQLLLNVTDSEDIDYLGEILQRSLNR